MPKHIAPEAFVHTRDINVLRLREWWTPMQAAIVLSRGEEFWRRAVVNGLCEGSIEGTAKRKTFKVCAASAREYATSIGKRRVVESNNHVRKLLADWRAKRKRERESNVHTDTVAVRQP